MRIAIGCHPAGLALYAVLGALLAEGDLILVSPEDVPDFHVKEPPVIDFGSHYLSDDMRPRAQTSGAFVWQPPRPKGKSLRRLPRLAPTGCDRNAGQIRALRLGRRKRRVDRGGRMNLEKSRPSP